MFSIIPGRMMQIIMFTLLKYAHKEGYTPKGIMYLSSFGSSIVVCIEAVFV